MSHSTSIAILCHVLLPAPILKCIDRKSRSVLWLAEIDGEEPARVKKAIYGENMATIITKDRNRQIGKQTCAICDYRRLRPADMELVAGNNDSVNLSAIN